MDGTSEGSDAPQVASDPNYWMIGDPSGLRYAGYCRAVLECGGLPPRCLGWDRIIEEGVSCLDAMPLGARLRIDSFGQNSTTLASLIRFGGGTVLPEYGQICSLDTQYIGMCNVMQSVCQWLETRPDIQSELHPEDIRVMFDKWATHHRVEEFRPQATLLSLEPKAFDEELRHFMGEVGPRVFIKPRYSSSASGVCCYRVAGGREQLISAIELVRTGNRVHLYNSLRVRSFTDPKDIRDIFRQLAPQGLIAEAAVNKARIDGDRFDLRIMVISGEVSHLVVRQSGSPITNLHLGNRRGSISDLMDTVGENRVERCKELAVAATSKFPRALYCGVDVLLPRSGEPLICEMNAFGDFLPNLQTNGMSVYATIYLAGRERKTAVNQELEA